MFLRLKMWLFKAVFASCIALAMSSTVQAGMHDHHNHSQISPFEKVKVMKPLHCLLKMHQHFQGNDCPHHNKGFKRKGLELRSDCGPDSDSAKASSSSFLKNLSGLSLSLNFENVSSSWNVFQKEINQLQNLPRSIDHPPHIS